MVAGKKEWKDGARRRRDVAAVDARTAPLGEAGGLVFPRSPPCLRAWER
jgi:hypothetical protein